MHQRVLKASSKRLFMKNLLAVLLTCLLVTLCPPLAHAQQTPPGRDPAFEQAIYDRLSAANPEAAKAFKDATVALDAGDVPTARQGYQRVLTLVPNSADAMRRLANIEVYTGNVDAGVELARQAYAIEPSPYNATALANALIATKAEHNYEEALPLAQDGARGAPKDRYANEVLVLAGWAGNDIPVMQSASANLLKMQPDSALGHYVTALVAVYDHQWEAAERELLLARQYGWPADVIQRDLDGDVASKAQRSRLMRQRTNLAVITLGAWIGGLAILFFLGMALSRVTATALRQPPHSVQYQPGQRERTLRGVYAAVIGLTSAYFYISVPAMVVLMAAIVIATLYVSPSGYMMILALVCGYDIVWALVASLLTRVKDAEPGRPLTRDEAPALWAVTEEVARRIGTRPVETIYVTAGVSIGVFERGPLWHKLRQNGRRCLLLGLGALPGLTQAQFKAILAHEYGHFSNRDTAGGFVALQVRASVYALAVRLADRGFAHKYHPVWLFVQNYYRAFLRMTLGASRLQEVLADRYAALAYGAQTAAGALAAIVHQGVAFDMQLRYEVEQAALFKRPLDNCYQLPSPEVGPLRAKFAEGVEKAMNSQTTPYDSHPAPQERIRLLQALATGNNAANVGVPASPEDQAPAWGLLANATALQNEMTAKIQANVKQYALR
jgi:Zn-dependent protease with chaperone function